MRKTFLIVVGLNKDKNEVKKIIEGPNERALTKDSLGKLNKILFKKSQQPYKEFQFPDYETVIARADSKDLLKMNFPEFANLDKVASDPVGLELQKNQKTRKKASKKTITKTAKLLYRSLNKSGLLCDGDSIAFSFGGYEEALRQLEKVVEKVFYNRK